VVGRFDTDVKERRRWRVNSPFYNWQIKEDNHTTE